MFSSFNITVISLLVSGSGTYVFAGRCLLPPPPTPLRRAPTRPQLPPLRFVPDMRCRIHPGEGTTAFAPPLQGSPPEWTQHRASGTNLSYFVHTRDRFMTGVCSLVALECQRTMPSPCVLVMIPCGVIACKYMLGPDFGIRYQHPMVLYSSTSSGMMRCTEGRYGLDVPMTRIPSMLASASSSSWGY